MFHSAQHGGIYLPGQITGDVAAARRLLAEAGYPDGKNFPTVEVLFNTLQSHKAIAEALQEMWKKNLNINIVLHNEEWKVYLDSMRQTNYDIGRLAGDGDYVDPSTFLDLFMTDSGNNETGWSNAEYDRCWSMSAVQHRRPGRSLRGLSKGRGHFDG